MMLFFVTEGSNAVQPGHSPVNIKGSPVIELAMIGAWVGIDGDSNGGDGGVAVTLPHIVLLNQDCIVHKHMVSHSSTCNNRHITCCLRSIHF